MHLLSETRKKTYSPPKLKKLTPDQAKLILIGHASCGSPGAKDLLNVLYPSPEPEGSHDVRAHFEEEKPAPITPRTLRIFRCALTALQSTREDFRRFLRG
jgi:hypothetical protein